MAIDLIAKNIWAEITRAVKTSRSKSMVAVAYFGQGAAKLLPLKKGSILLVDASEKNVKGGQTCPEDLLKLYYKGVHVYSLEKLHAKVYIVGKSAFIGSANATINSSKLKEVVLRTGDSGVIKQAKAFIDSCCMGKIEMGEEQLLRLKKLYRPPLIAGGKDIDTKRIKHKEAKQPPFLVYKLDLNDWTEEEEKQAEIGREKAKQNRIHKSRHYLDEFKLTGKIAAQKGDTVMQITNEGNETYVSPPGTLIHIRKWNNGKQLTNFCYVEIPQKRRKNLKSFKKFFTRKTFTLINRNGRKNKELAKEIIELWKLRMP